MKMKDKEITLKFNLDEVNVILTGLSELPSKISYGLITKIKNDAQNQIEDEDTNKLDLKND